MMPATLRFIVGPVTHKRRVLLIEIGPVTEATHKPDVPHPARRVRIANRGGVVAAFRLEDTQQVDLSVSATDVHGHPAEIEGSLTWASSDESVLSVQAAADGMSATAVGVAPGSAQVQVNDAETDGTNIAGTLDVEVVAGPAVSVTVTPGEVTDQA